MTDDERALLRSIESHVRVFVRFVLFAIGVAIYTSVQYAMQDYGLWAVAGATFCWFLYWGFVYMIRSTARPDWLY